MSKLVVSTIVTIVFIAVIAFDSDGTIVSNSPSAEFRRNYAGYRLVDTQATFFYSTLYGTSLLRCGAICATLRTITCSYFQFIRDSTDSDASGTCQIGNTPIAEATAAKSSNILQDDMCDIFMLSTTTTGKTIQQAIITTSTAYTNASRTTTAASTTLTTASAILTTASGNWSQYSKQDSESNPVDSSICKSIKESSNWNCNCSSNIFCQGILQCDVQFENGTAYYFLDRTSSAINRYDADSQCDSLGMNMIMTKTTESFNVVCQILYYAAGTASNESYWMGASEASNSTTWIFDDGTAVSAQMTALITNDTSGNNYSGGKQSRHKRSPAGGQYQNDRYNNNDDDNDGNHNRNIDDDDHNDDHGDDITNNDNCVVIAGDGSNFVLKTRNCSMIGDSMGWPNLFFCANYMHN